MRKVYHKIIQIAGNVITVEAEDVRNGELAEVTSSRITSLAQVIRLQGTKVFLQVFAGSRGISTGDEIPCENRNAGRSRCHNPRRHGPQT
jgi:V/A-type H+-transporting ATPase subunit B